MSRFGPLIKYLNVFVFKEHTVSDFICPLFVLTFHSQHLTISNHKKRKKKASHCVKLHLKNRFMNYIETA